jgi:hypothetical protein
VRVGGKGNSVEFCVENGSIERDYSEFFRKSMTFDRWILAANKCGISWVIQKGDDSGASKSFFWGDFKEL